MNIHWDALGTVDSTVNRPDMDSILKSKEQTGNKNTTNQINE